MRAIFMIPTSDPPTLPNPEKWSKDFHDFLKVCLVKDPEKRPTATALLKTHPFITKAKGKEVIAHLVAACMKEIDEYREQEAKEAEEKEAGDDGGGTFGTGDISTLDTSTMVGQGGSSTMERSSGTTVPSGTVDSSKGTFVFSSTSGGTMVKNSDPTVSSGTTKITPGGSGPSGTMVFNSGGTIDLSKKKKNGNKVRKYWYCRIYWNRNDGIKRRW
jgi:serine/threonine protein kinase